MRPFPGHPPAPTDTSRTLTSAARDDPEARDLDPTVMVSMCDDHLVICAHSEFDVEMTETLVVAAASAVATGSTVMIDLDPDLASDELVARGPLRAIDAECITRDGGPVTVLGAGQVRLATRDGNWTIDLSQGRLCRSDHAIDPHFLRPADWTPVRALWVTPTSLTALNRDGTYLSTVAAWTVHRPTRQAIA